MLANDTDADSDPLTAALVTDVSHGTLTLNANGSFSYSPSSGYSGPDSFTYKANDGGLDSNVVTVSIGVGNSGLQLTTSSYVTFGDPSKLDLAPVHDRDMVQAHRPRHAEHRPATAGSRNLVPLLTHGAPQAEGSNVDANWILGIDTATSTSSRPTSRRSTIRPDGRQRPDQRHHADHR